MKNPVRHGILATVGQTPLVRLTALEPSGDLEVHAKLERFNPTGSIEDRTALDLLVAPIRSGEIVPGQPVVLEADSGNLAISLAQTCRYYGIDLHLVVEADTATAWHRAMLKAFGARVELVHAAHDQAQLSRLADALAATLPGAYRPPRGRWTSPEGVLMREIREGLTTEPHYVFCPTSSAVALRNVIAHIRVNRLATTVVAVADDPAAPHPASFGLSPADLVVAVDELDVVAGCRRLLGREGLLAGRSSGAVVAALAQLRGQLEAGAVCVLVLPDGGDRYAETIYSDAWVESRVGTVPELQLAYQEASR
ncbi:cysteine synthase [Kitasatospora sp. MAA4]|uniref:pyridoxal-phosphate dependent enzyme n=1 Tax=Kitasatospora sp. MAA4 TaxID=3035093 RepID=UPI002473DDA1|nr:pyridoxal-phosphate dependent enzyme [Kitasatospora sp. MAA4]MDH6135330.1 cysteine synthase [Kitasatospora sp. MAA4]